jgi:signal transduction histidine kinase
MTGRGEPELTTILNRLEQENRQLREDYLTATQQLIGLRLVQYVTQDLVSELDVDLLLKRILRSAIAAVYGAAGALILLDHNRSDLVFAVVEGGGGAALEGQRIGRDQGLAGWVMTHRKPLLAADVRQDERFHAQTSEQVGFQVESLICAPLMTKGAPIGVVQILNKTVGDRFDEEDLELLTSFAAQSAIAIENTRLYQDLKRERDRLLAIEDQVRRRLARDLHDGPAQLLAALISNLDFARQLQMHEPDKLLEELEGLLPLAHKALRQVRSLLFDLRPVVLETQGLVPALQAYVERLQSDENLNCHLQIVDFSGRLNSAAEQAIFGIVQEAVGNVRRHAYAENVWIEVTAHEADLRVTVRDDGCGFDLEKLNAEYDERGSLGMLNMRERSDAIGGTLQVHTEPGSGTSVTLSAPLGPLRASG